MLLTLDTHLRRPGPRSSLPVKKMIPLIVIRIGTRFVSSLPDPLVLVYYPPYYSPILIIHDKDKTISDKSVGAKKATLRKLIKSGNTPIPRDKMTNQSDYDASGCNPF